MHNIKESGSLVVIKVFGCRTWIEYVLEERGESRWLRLGDVYVVVRVGILSDWEMLYVDEVFVFFSCDEILCMQIGAGIRFDFRP